MKMMSSLTVLFESDFRYLFLLGMNNKESIHIWHANELLSSQFGAFMIYRQTSG